MANTSKPDTAAVLALFDTLPPSAYVKRGVVQGLWGGITDDAVDHLEKAGKIPPRVKIGARLNGWQVGELREALAALATSAKGR